MRGQVHVVGPRRDEHQPVGGHEGAEPVLVSQWRLNNCTTAVVIILVQESAGRPCDKNGLGLGNLEKSAG